MLTGLLWRRGASLAALGAGWGIREPIVGLQRTSGWLPGANLLLTLGTSLVALIVVSAFEGRSLRYTAAATPAMLAVGIGALAQQQRRAHFQMLALLMTGLATVYLGWADLLPRWDERGLLLRMFRLLMALSALTFVYGVLVPRWFGAQHVWRESMRRAAATFGMAGVVSLLGVLAMEFVAFRTGGIPVAGAQVAAVAVVLVALIAGLIALSLQTGGVLSSWSEAQRMSCVYAAELTAALLFVHLYLCRPEWFGGFLLPYWPYIMMGCRLCRRLGRPLVPARRSAGAVRTAGQHGRVSAVAAGRRVLGGCRRGHGLLAAAVRRGIDVRLAEHPAAVGGQRGRGGDRGERSVVGLAARQRFFALAAAAVLADPSGRFGFDRRSTEPPPLDRRAVDGLALRQHVDDLRQFDQRDVSCAGSDRVSGRR
jgi:hypothetical protein